MYNNSAQLCLLLIFVLHVHIAIGEQQKICDTISCGEIDIQFPFGLKGSSNNNNYPRFQLSCDNNSNTILTLPSSGDLVVKSINYVDQTIKVNDPSGCLPKRFLHNLSFSGSPFTLNDAVYGFHNLTFLRCPSNVTHSYSYSYPLPPISCLSSDHIGNSESTSSVVIVSSNSWWEPSTTLLLFSECEVMTWAFVPVPNMSLRFDPNSDIELVWKEPRCGDCAARGQLCGFITNSSSTLQVGCFSDPNKSQDLSRSAKYGITIGVGVTGLISIFGLCCLLSSQFKMRTHFNRPIIVLPIPTDAQPGPTIMGLDGPTIEKFPKTLIGESGSLPKPNDKTCPICLCEYEPKESLRTIPDCNHYFHAHCVDEWLKMNPTCPICRNSLEGSSNSFSPSSLYITLSLSSSTQIMHIPPHIF